MSTKIITDISLKNYFYQKLDELNKKSLCPVPQETIFYSSNILEKYSFSDKLFEIRDGKVSEKILGEKMLKANGLSTVEQKREYKDIGDTALFISGYFRKSFEQKLYDINYYYNLGKIAYSNLNQIDDQEFKIPCFYNVLSTCFENLTILISTLALTDSSNPHSHLLLENIFDNKYSEKELLIQGVQIHSKKAN